MSVDFHNLPIEIYSHKMIPELDLVGTVSWSLASKVWQTIFQNISTVPDFDLQGNDRTCDFGEDDERPRALFLSKIKWLKFQTVPGLADSLAKMNGLSCAMNDQIIIISSRAHTAHDSTTMLAIVVFDYTTKKLNWADLDGALDLARESDSKLARAVIIHPNANEIPGSALSNPLVGAIKAQNQGLAKLFLANPRSHELQGKGLLNPIIAAIEANETEIALQLLARSKAQDFSSSHLAKMLETAIAANNQPVSAAILGLPKMKEVLATEIFGPLIAAIKTNNQEVITWAFGQPNVAQIRENDLLLPDAITATIEANNQEVLQLLLNLPNAKRMPSYALVRPLMTAIRVRNQDLIQMILKHPRLKEMDPIDLSSLIKEAIQENNPDVMQALLDFPNTNLIPASGPYDGKSFGDLSDEVDLMDDPNLTSLFRSHPVVKRALDAELDEVELERADSDIEDPNAIFEESQEGPDSSEDQSQSQNM